ncbi:hypothetical protein FQR65_LT01918 [Abscondita terminalis]|nr:hypothetical protein FQR65_LT01918 [Abscondita terminalis]
MYKIIIALCFVLGNHLDHHEEACITETRVSRELVLDAKKENVVYGDNEKYKEYMSCCWRKYGYQHANGEIRWERIREVLEEAYKPRVVVKLINKCIDVEGDTPGDTVVMVLRCLDEHAPNLHSIHHYY